MDPGEITSRRYKISKKLNTKVSKQYEVHKSARNIKTDQVRIGLTYDGSVEVNID